MKKNSFLKWVGIGALTLGLFFNLQYALIDYGMFDNTLGYQLVAQANTGGSTSGGGSTDDGGGSTDDGGGSTDDGGGSTNAPAKYRYVITFCPPAYDKSCKDAIGIDGRISAGVDAKVYKIEAEVGGSSSSGCTGKRQTLKLESLPDSNGSHTVFWVFGCGVYSEFKV